MIEKTGVDATKETEPIILDVYNKKLKRDYKVPTLTDPCHGTIRLIEPRIITHHMPEIVKVRKYEVDIPALKECLKKHKKPIKELQKELEIPKTTIEHWFRKDSSFSIPDAEIWFQLKSILGIETDEFDKSITEFEEREGVFEKGNRVYDENGLSPTLTSTSASEEKILVRPEVNAGDYRYDEGFRWRENGKSPTLTARAREDFSGPPLVNTFRIRRLTPIECERLQTVADNYTNHVSDSQRYKMLGNGWTVDVIAHIFSHLK